MGLHENPLVPNAKLRQMYVAMVEARVLDEHLAGLAKRAKKKDKGGNGRRSGLNGMSIRGHEACRISTAIDLGPGDLVSDSQPGVVMELLAGATVNSVLKRAAALHAGKRPDRAMRRTASRRLLPWAGDAEERLRLAMGAALSFRALGRENVVVAYAGRGEVGKGAWRRVLELAAKLELPMIFVVLPAAEGESEDEVAHLSPRTARWGVPGILVDAGDAVAIYRVAQESLGRTRGGDGPVLIECAGFRTKGSGGRAAGDPVSKMKDFLLSRGVATRGWLDGAGDGLRRQIGSVQTASARGTSAREAKP